MSGSTITSGLSVCFVHQRWYLNVLCAYQGWYIFVCWINSGHKMLRLHCINIELPSWGCINSGMRLSEHFLGDGYMVASGLPVRNGDKHVSEIALLALDLRDTMAELEIPHLNNEKFRLRIGFNTGNCWNSISAETVCYFTRRKSKKKKMLIYM